MGSRTRSNDAYGRLLSTTGGVGGDKSYSYDGDHVAGEFAVSSNGPLGRYVFGPGGDEPLVWYYSGGLVEPRWLYADEKGSVIATADATGATVAINSYNEYGINGAAHYGAFGYTGQHWIPEAGLYDYKARMYSPTLGRFMQTDPIGYGDGVNIYNYTHSDPINGSDPSGTLNLWKAAPTVAIEPYVPCKWDGSCIEARASFSFRDLGDSSFNRPHIDADLQRINNLNGHNDGGAPQTNSCGAPSILPHGLGLSVGGSADAGVPSVVGAAANGSAGVGAFYSAKAGGSVGAFAGGGAAAYAGGASASAVAGSKGVVAGASAGGGFSVFVTNAQSARQLAGPFTTYSLSIGFGPIQGAISVSVGGGIYQVSLSPPGFGVTASASASKVTTTTVATGGCS